ncbi:MAG: hypothetical protein LBL21_03900 [Rickettsiales bacterium]|jgi:hypothetical protein|nr:hypothetical protein [Rickettsiales bacterium]
MTQTPAFLAFCTVAAAAFPIFADCPPETIEIDGESVIMQYEEINVPDSCPYGYEAIDVAGACEYGYEEIDVAGNCPYGHEEIEVSEYCPVGWELYEEPDVIAPADDFCPYGYAMGYAPQSTLEYGSDQKGQFVKICSFD